MTIESPAAVGRGVGRAGWSDRRILGGHAARPGPWVGLTGPADLVTELLTGISRAGWSVQRRAGRTVVTPAAVVDRVQGWKLHVSATVLSAPEVLAGCVPLLVETGTPFSFVDTVAGLARLNGPWANRVDAGKFLTAYPEGDELFRELAKRLDEATVGLAGPRIASDLPYRVGGVVHYRYGAFAGVRVLDHDGGYRRCVVDPDGNLVEDRREPEFQPPRWVEPPFDPPPDRPAPAGLGPHWPIASIGTVRAGATGAAGSTGTGEPVDPAGPAAVLLGGRYAVIAAVRQANRGGVYRARDLRTGVEVRIKEARPHVGTDARGRDVRDLLGHEARVLRHLAPLGVGPRPLREFVQGEHQFLVEELLPGRPLRDAVRDFPDTGPDGLDGVGLVGLLGRLARLVGRVHSVGVVLRNLNPENVLVLPDGELRLVDLELAALRTGGLDDWSCLDAHGADPAGFVAPEQLSGAAPDGTADLFSLGMLALYLVGRTAPPGPADLPPTRSLEERVAVLVNPSLGGRPIPAPLCRLVTGLLRTEPAERIGLAEVEALCAAVPAEPDQHRGRTSGVLLPVLPEWDWCELVGGLVARLIPDLDRSTGSALTGSSGRGVEPHGVHNGVAGPIGVLTRLIAAGPTLAGSGLGASSSIPLGASTVSTCVVPGTGSQLRGAIEPGTFLRAGRVLDTLLDRLLDQLDREPHRLPGLYAGSAGTAWALCDAGRLLGRPYLVDRAVDLALRLPVVWPDPGLSNGVAGLGSCLLHLWQHTYLPELRDRVTAAAGHLLGAIDRGAEMLWTVDPSFDSAYAGQRSYGFAHGTAGIGSFLLAVGHLLGRRDLTTAAVRCADTLLDAARYVDDAALWPGTPTASVVGPHWYDGSAGIGTFLCQLYVRTGEPRYLAGSVAAGQAVWRARWSADPSYWHGLAGGADLLLDLARATGDDRYARRAEALAARLWAIRVFRDGVALLPDESDRGVDSGFGTGLTGQLAFLLRLRDGGPRLFHPDPEREPAPRAVPCSGGPACRC